MISKWINNSATLQELKKIISLLAQKTSATKIFLCLPLTLLLIIGGKLQITCRRQKIEYLKDSGKFGLISLKVEEIVGYAANLNKQPPKCLRLRDIICLHVEIFIGGVVSVQLKGNKLLTLSSIK